MSENRSSSDPNLTPLWKRYLEAVNKDPKDLPSLYNEAKNESRWQTYGDAIKAISSFLIANRNIELSTIPPQIIDTLHRVGMDIDEISQHADDGQWRDTLVFVKNLFERRKDSAYPWPSGENDGGGNVWGSMRMKYNTGRDKRGRDINE